MNDFINTLKATGIPVDGCSNSGVGSASERYEIQFRPEATEAQRQEAEQLKKDFDWRERKPKDRDALRTEVNNLATIDFNELDRADRLECLVERLLAEPDFGRKLGINIDGDELI